MKKCSWCGKEYPDAAVECPTDGHPLTGDEPQVQVLTEASQNNPAIPPVIGEAGAAFSIPAPRFSERQIRIFELVLVCVIAFGGSILVSTFRFLGWSGRSSSWSGLTWSNFILHEAGALALLWYVLLRRSKSFRDLGLSWRTKDLGWSVLLLVAGYLCYGAVYELIQLLGLTATSASVAGERVARSLFPAGVPALALLAQMVNPVFEESIVRGYVMTEVKQLTGSVSKAVIFSTALQTSYHFYQGAPMAISEGAMFLLFSIYYARSNRLAPLILAHLYVDLGNTLVVYMRQSGAS